MKVQVPEHIIKPEKLKKHHHEVWTDDVMVTQDRKTQTQPGHFFFQIKQKTIFVFVQSFTTTTFLHDVCFSGTFARTGRVQCFLITPPILVKRSLCLQQSNEKIHPYIS